jgi:hypothetical protein
MKLVLCPECRDVVSLARTERRCLCGKVGGAYYEDGLRAVVNGGPVVIGIDSKGIVAAASAANLFGPESAETVTLNAFVIPVTATTVRRT